MAKLGGDPSLAAVELTTQNYYFAFQIVQVFLVVTIASAATSVVTSIIANPSSAASLLAKNIPRASNFYVSYIILQGLTFSAGALLQIGGLIVGKILGRLFDSTPRKMYKRWSNLAGLGWGTVYPVFTMLTVIGTLPFSPHYLQPYTRLTPIRYHLLLHCSSGDGVRLRRSVPVLLRL